MELGYNNLKMDEIVLPYGRKQLKVNVPSASLCILEPGEGAAIDIVSSLKKALQNPIGTPPLEQLIKKGDAVAIIVPDITRRNPLNELLPPLLEEAERCGAGELNLIIGNAMHKHHPLEEFGLSSEVLKKVRVYNHDGRKKGELVKIGRIPSPVNREFLRAALIEIVKTFVFSPIIIYKAIFKRGHIIAPLLKIIMLVFSSAGRDVFVNKIAAEADLVIVTGSIIPHLMAGFAGGAKGIVPGVAGFETIALNHFLMPYAGVGLGKMEGNVLREDLERGAGLLKNVFLINAVYDRRKQVIGLFAGDMIKAHREGVKLCRRIGEKTNLKKADIVISSDGFPETINIYQTLKLIAPAAEAVKPGGVIICAGECPGGEGELTLFNRLFYWLLLNKFLPKGVDIYFLTEASDIKRFPFFLKPIASIEEGIKLGFTKRGPSASVLVLKGAGLLIPV